MGEMPQQIFVSQIKDKLAKHFRVIYGDDQVEECLKRLDELLKKYNMRPVKPVSANEVWNHHDVILITYGDMVQPKQGEPISNLHKLHIFLNQKFKGLVTTIHILPFFPSSSDDGFSVIDYKHVNSSIGGWNDITKISKDFKVMGDLVINHTSRYSSWFRKYLKEEKPYTDYFIEVDPNTDMSGITRPRSSSILTHVHTRKGEKYVWSTFSDDQIDVNFNNPDVLFEFIDILLFYISKGISVIRLDAVAFIWKKFGTSSIHLHETHEIVKLFRSITDIYAPGTTLISETNVPHNENISYFGKGDEAHLVYQFSLPPLLLHALLFENAKYLTEWSASLLRQPENCTFFNFTASHDGIGVRPLEGLLPQNEFNQLIEGIKEKGGFVSEKKNPDGSVSPYELNITYYDAFKDVNGESGLHEKRFICSQLIALSLVGIPGIYFHNFTATPNNLEGVSTTGRYRTINRKKWDYDDIIQVLNNPETSAYRVFDRLKKAILERKQHPAFHPFGYQKTYNISEQLFCVERWDPDETERILMIANVTSQSIKTILDHSLPLNTETDYVDELSEEKCVSSGELILEPYQVIWLKLI